MFKDPFSFDSIPELPYFLRQLLGQDERYVNVAVCQLDGITTTRVSSPYNFVDWSAFFVKDLAIPATLQCYDRYPWVEIARVDATNRTVQLHMKTGYHTDFHLADAVSSREAQRLIQEALRWHSYWLKKESCVCPIRMWG